MSPIPSRHRRHTAKSLRSRPREYDPLLADRILELVREGDLLPEICEDVDMPTAGTFIYWCEQDPHLAEQYRLARCIGNEVNFDEALIAAHGHDPMTARVRSEALRWHVERTQPEKYGPRATIRQQKAEDDEGAGIDYGSEVRRRIEQMAERQSVHKAAEGGGS